MKHEKNRSSTSGSGGSRESSPQSNPRLDDVLLKTMNASASEVKPGLQDPTEKPALLDQPGNPAVPDQLAKPPLPDTPAKPALPDKPTKPTLPEKPANLASLETVVKPALTNPTVKPVILNKPVKPAIHDEGAKPTLPDKPAKPAKPAKPDQLAKPALPAPLSAAQVHQIQTADKPVMAANNSDSLGQRSAVGLLGEDVVDQGQRAVTADSTLHIPSQGTSRRFTGQQRMKKSHKLQGNTMPTSKPHRTFSLKARRSNTLEKPKLVKCDSVDAGNTKKGVLPNFAENTVNNLFEFEGKGDFKQSGREDTERLSQGK